MPFKTPLSHHFDELVTPEHRFSPQMLFDSCKAKKINFGLWIDLTNTKRFYNKDMVESQHCNYIKLECRGHGEAPSEQVTATFIGLVENFIIRNPLKHIAVHCTHGFNRTGFLIISYLVQRMDISVEIALDMFAKARPPGIYKEDYIEELYRRYDDVEDAPPPPERPDWCFDGEGAQASGAEQEGSSSNGLEPPKKKSRKNGATAQFMDGVPRVSHFTDHPKAFQLQKKCRDMCGWKTKGFPGSQPVSMDKDNIHLLHEKPYRVSWKADGMRYMMLIDGYDEVYFFDRDHNVFKVEGMRFPYRKDPKRDIKNTLVDGEMVIDKVNNLNVPRFLIYDIIKFDGHDVSTNAFCPTRLQIIDFEIIKPRHRAIINGSLNKDLEPFGLRLKQFWPIIQASNLLGEKFAATLAHEPDGLIFQPAKERYVPGRCDDVLKWKPLDMNSVDFKLKIVQQTGEGIVTTKICELYVGQMKTPFAKMKFTNAMKEFDNKIIECKFENSQWKFMRVRTDKSWPNSYTTAQAVCGSIKHPVTKERLLEFIDQYRFDDDSEMMPPPRIQQR